MTSLIQDSCGPVDCFNEYETVPKLIKAYKAEMTKTHVGEAMRPKCFCQVVSLQMHEEVKKLQETHDSWETIEEMPLENYNYDYG